MIRTQISLADEDHKTLKREAADRGISLSQVIRELVQEHLRSHSMRKEFTKDDFLSVVSLGRSGETDVSVNHDEHVGL